MSKNLRTIAAKVTPELNIHHGDPVSTKTVRRQPCKSSIHSRAASVKLLITAKTVLKDKKDSVMIVKLGSLTIRNM